MTRLSAEQLRILGERISESDREAFDHLFRSLYPQLVRFAFRYLQKEADAGDIVQDAFVILWEKRAEIDPQSSVKAYLYHIVRNRSLNYLRDHSDKTVGLEVLGTTNSGPTSDLNGNPGPQDATGTGVEVGDEVKKGEDPEKLADLLDEWIEELPDRRREAFELSRFDGLDHEEIAGVMDVSPNTVNNHIVAALNYLRGRYDGYQKAVNNELTGYD